MRTLIISFFSIALSASDIVRAQGSSCVNMIDTSQNCVKQCLSTGSLNVDSNGAQYGNRLFECLDSDEVPEQLGTCCGMNLTCATALEEATQCLQDELSNVSATAVNYLQCISDRRSAGQCPFAQYCVSVLAGGYGSNATNAFGVGYEMTLGVMTIEATSCADMNIFGENACTEVKGCCEPCADIIASVVNAVVDDLLLPGYNSTLRDCGGEKTCDNYTNIDARQLENVDGSSVGSAIIDITNSLDTSALADECNHDLVNEIIVYNTTSAVTNFFECLQKKMGQIIAESDANEIESQKSSSTSFFRGASATTLTAIVSSHFVLLG